MKMHPLAVYGVVLSSFLGYTGAGFGLGYWLWKSVGVSWWVMLATTMMGLAFACWSIIRLQQKQEKESDESSGSERP